jgi:antitoxin CcdA
MDAISRRHPNSTQLSTKVDSEAVLTAGAKALGVDVAPAADCGIADAVPLGPQERWIAENLEALKSSNAYVEQHGLPLAKHHNS